MRLSFSKVIILTFLALISDQILGQRVYPLVPGITVDSILSTKPGASKMAMEAISGRLFYTTAPGDIYEVYIPATGAATDSLRYTAADHGITTLQGLYFRDSIMYLCGNVWTSTTGIGMVVKGVLKPNKTRVWTTIVTTDPYPSTSPYGDHGFAGVTLDPIGNYIYVSSGSRTLLGEIRTNSGAWPGYREVPVTCKIFKFPVNSVGIVLPDDSTLIDNSGYVFAWGTRNAYDMAWDGNDTLFAIDNSGERDDPEELNWLRKGKHYGYPWRMGGNDNPLRFSPYNVNLDPLVNPNSGGYTAGWFADDPTFPPAPIVTFIEPIRNYGLVADFFKDNVTGKVKNASDVGSYITSFTSHRSPLGLVFDTDSALASGFRGDGFVLNFMPGGDSTGYTPLSPWGSPCPFVDPSRELVQLKLKYDASITNYTMTTSNVAGGFYLPVDAELANNKLYVIENGGDIWRITFPTFSGVNELSNNTTTLVYPNPFSQSTTIEFENTTHNNYTLNLYNAFGQVIRTIHNITTNKIVIERGDLATGFYFFQLDCSDKSLKGKLIVN